MSSLETAQLAIYAVLCLPVLYLLFRHGKPGIIGWIYLFAFCTLRVVGGAMAVSKGSDDETAAIISNIGLSPLLLAISGILHESRHYRIISGSTKMEWVLVLTYHLLVTSGLALVASGASAFKGSDPNPSDEGLLKGGIIILLLAWVVVCLWSFYSLLPSQANRNASCYNEATKLLYAVIFALPFAGIRMLYSVISILAPSTELSPVKGSLGLRLGLSFIPELIAVLALILAGLATQRIRYYTNRFAGAEASRTRRAGKRGSPESEIALGKV